MLLDLLELFSGAASEVGLLLCFCGVRRYSMLLCFAGEIWSLLLLLSEYFASYLSCSASLASLLLFLSECSTYIYQSILIYQCSASLATQLLIYESVPLLIYRVLLLLLLCFFIYQSVLLRFIRLFFCSCWLFRFISFFLKLS